MNIVDKREANKVKFADCNVGDIIEYANVVYMAIPPFCSGVYNVVGLGLLNSYNKINISGELYFIRKETLVTRVDGTLTIESIE